MNPSTGTFITMDEYAGSIFEPVSLHKYLYANANPVMNSDPSGYETLNGLMTSMAMQAELAATVGAFYGGILNSLLAVVNGGTQEQIQMAFLEGMATGFIFGGIFGGLGALAAHYWQLQLLMSALQFTGGYYAFQGATKAALKGNWGESAIYAAAGVSCTFSSANYLKNGLNGYHNSNQLTPQLQIKYFGKSKSVYKFLQENVPEDFRKNVAYAFKSDAKVTKLKEDLEVYRYYGGNSQSRSFWYTPYKLENPKVSLALPEANTCEYMDTYIIPKGTIILEGTVAPNFGYPGGGYQIYVPDSNIPILK